LDVELTFKKKEYFKSLMMASSMIESFLRRFYVYSFRIKNNGKLLTNHVDEINRISLYSIMKWANSQKINIKKEYSLPIPKKKILNNKQYGSLEKLKDIRNDIAHTYYLSYDENINYIYAEKILRSSVSILNDLIKKYNKLVKTS
jgi:dihydroxyacetone kinase-like predicted kinase